MKITNRAAQSAYDSITMIFSPLVENLFDGAEVVHARCEKRNRKQHEREASATPVMRDARATDTHRSGSLGS